MVEIARAVYIELCEKRRLRALHEPLWARGVAVAVRRFPDKTSAGSAPA
jgi:hypothetical protein